MTVGGLAAAALVAGAGHRVEVLAVAREVPVGQTIESADLTVARIAADPALRPVPVTGRSAVVGRVAAVELRAGSLLTAAALTDRAIPGSGEQLLGVPAGAGQLPARGLRSGDRVLLVSVPGDGTAASTAGSGSATDTGGLQVTARVVQVGPADVDGKSTVDVLVPAAVGPSVAVAASAGRIVLILLPAQGD